MYNDNASTEDQIYAHTSDFAGPTKKLIQQHHTEVHVWKIQITKSVALVLLKHPTKNKLAMSGEAA